MFTLALVGVFIFPIATWAHTPWANLTTAQRLARKHLCAEIEANNQFLELNVDFIGGVTAPHSFSKSAPTKNEAERMGKEYREKLIRYFMGLKDDGSDPVVPTCKTPIVCDPKVTFRSADGACNNLNHADWGKSIIPMRRFLPPAYGNGVNEPRTKGKSGQPLPSPRKITTSLHTLDSESTKALDVTHMTMQFAQFLDHDITNTPMQKGALGAAIECCSPIVAELIANGTNGPRPECFPIEVPDGDDVFEKSCMNFVRSLQITNAKCEVVPAEQMNQITAFLDASQVYGSDRGDQAAVRSRSGGLLRVTGHSDELLPKDPERDCVTSGQPNYCFKAGDARVNDQMGLTSMHTIWLREHNRIARKLAQINYQWNDERLFQETRRIVGAMLQHITYTEWLPVILSQTAINENNLGPSYRYSDSYDSNVDPSIRNAFSTAAFRFGHSMIKTNFGERDGDYNSIDDLKLTTSFGNTSIIIQSQGDAVNNIIRGLTDERAQSVDRFITKEIRDRLFLDTTGSLDLIALNLQRGRDHGLQGYNSWRKWCSLAEAKEFKTGTDGFIDHPQEVLSILSSLYKDPDDIDLFSAGISEKALDDGLLGPTFSCIVARQFRNLKVGDRFWYETNDETLRFTEDQLDELHTMSLARIICENTDTTKIQPNVFRTVSGSNARINCNDITSLNLDLWSNDEHLWSDWSKFSDCEDGKKTRTRECLSKNNGTRPLIPLECSGEDKQEKKCGTERDCDWDNWSEWGNCVKGCHYRHRTCPCHSCKEGEGLDTANCEGKTNDKCHEVYHIIRKWYEFDDCGLCS